MIYGVDAAQADTVLPPPTNPLFPAAGSNTNHRSCVPEVRVRAFAALPSKCAGREACVKRWPCQSDIGAFTFLKN